MGDVIFGHTFPRNPQSGAKDTQIRTREDAVDHLAAELSKMLDEGDTLMVLPDVEMPADCPA